MQVICDGLDLCEAVLKVSKAISSRTTNPILEGIKLHAEEDKLILSATDLDLSIEKKINAEVKIEGDAIVPGRFFTEFIKKLTDQKIELILNEKNQLKIRYEDSEGEIQCFYAVEYPSIKTVETENYFGITKTNFKNLINKCIFSVATDDARPILKGAKIEVNNNNIRAIALDGYRLALVNQKIVSNIVEDVIIPARSLSEISKLLDDSDDIVNVYIQDNYCMVDLGDTKIITRTLEGDFLNYRQILSSNFETYININKGQMQDALERASLLSKVGQNNLVKFDIKDSNMLLSSNSDIGNIKENLAITLTGKDLQIAFNARYFMEAFRVINDEFIKISFNSPTTPCVITPIDSDEYLYLILPVRII